MKTPKVSAKLTPRVVRSLHFSREADARIVRAARLSGEAVAAFIRAGAEERALRVTERDARKAA